MNDDLDRRDIEPDFDDVGQLLRLIAPPESVSRMRQAKARAAARLEWQRVVKARRRKQWLVSLAAAAALLLIVLGLRFSTQSGKTTQPIAVAEVVSGSVRVGVEANAPGTAGAVGVADDLEAGTTIVTGSDGRAALRLAFGQSIRLDHESRARLLSSDVIELISGALYVDSDARTPSGRSLEIRTAFGIVRNIGTQFEVRIVDETLRVRVREGSVLLDQGENVLEAAAGEEFAVDPAGNPSTASVPLHGEPWDWSLSVSPPYELEGKTLEDFLSVVTRETGWQVEFGDPRIQRNAGEVILHGDLDDLAIDRAVPSVLETCGLEHRRLDGVLHINYRGVS